MSRYFAAGALALLIMVAGYLLLRSGPAEAPAQPKPERVEKKPAQSPGTMTAAVSGPAEEAEEAPAPSPEKEEMAARNETETAAPATEEEDGEEGEAEEEDEKPTVKRSQLIGGADVEWIEPKPRDPDDKFGLPPGW
jgi:hypothetical protein